MNNYDNDIWQGIFHAFPAVAHNPVSHEVENFGHIKKAHVEYQEGIDIPVYVYTYTLRTYYGMIHIELSSGTLVPSNP